jgi:PIN domain
MPWSAGARAALEALRRARDSDGGISVAAALIAWIDSPPPGVSALHAVLADGARWSMLQQYRLLISGSRDAMRGLQPGAVRPLGLWEIEAEALARSEGVLRVSERHLVGVMNDVNLREVGINGPGLKKEVRDTELGSAHVAAELMAWNHVALDLSALIEYQRPDQIAWEQVIGTPGVVLWVVASVLNELDAAKHHKNQEVANRARARGRWLWDQVGSAVTPGGSQIRPHGTVLRVWAAASATPFSDTDHLEAVLELRAHGYRIQVITDDTLMAARAAAAGLQARRMDDGYRDPKASRDDAHE